MRLGVIFRFLVTTFSAHALRTGAHLHAVCMHIFPQNGAISCKIMQNRMIASRTGIFTYTFVAKQLGCRTRLRPAIGRRFANHLRRPFIIAHGDEGAIPQMPGIHPLNSYFMKAVRQIAFFDYTTRSPLTVASRL
jgi:hypothetical protein